MKELRKFWKGGLLAGYRAMAEDREQEKEAQEWSEALIADAAAGRGEKAPKGRVKIARRFSAGNERQKESKSRKFSPLTPGLKAGAREKSGSRVTLHEWANDK